MTAITQALARWGVMQSGDLYEHVKDDFGSQRSFERALADTPGLLRLGSTRSRAYALRRLGQPLDILLQPDNQLFSALA